MVSFDTVPQPRDVLSPPDYKFTEEICKLCLRQGDTNPGTNYCHGTLNSNSGAWNQVDKVIAPSKLSNMKCTVSLAVLLECRMLDAGTRLSLGVHLASSVVQLHSTLESHRPLI